MENSHPEAFIHAYLYGKHGKLGLFRNAELIFMYSMKSIFRSASNSQLCIGHSPHTHSGSAQHTGNANSDGNSSTELLHGI